MTEYRIVCDRDELHVYNGKEYHSKAVRPWLGGVPVNNKFNTREEAEAFLRRATEECARQDARKQADTSRNVIKTWQTNIRIQTREVSEWEDE